MSNYASAFPSLDDLIEHSRPPDPDLELLKKRQEAMQRKILFMKKTSSTPPPAKSDPVFSTEEKPDFFLPDYKNSTNIKTKISFELHSKQEVLLKSNYTLFDDIKDIIKSFSGRLCNETNAWIVPLSEYKGLKSSLEKNFNIAIESVPRFVISAVSEPREGMLSCNSRQSRMESVKTVSDLPEALVSKLYPFQIDGIKFVLSRHGRALIGDEMGCGKTIEAIISAFAYIEEWPLLVICPASIKLNWRDEFLKWLPELHRKDFIILDSKKNSNAQAKVWIVSYSMANSLESFFKSKCFQVIIADECHYLKNFSAKRTKTIVPMLQRSKRVLLLSGTPVISRPSELYNLLTAIRPDVFRSFKDFANRYCEPKTYMNHVDYSGCSNMKELYTLLSSTVMIRRLKADVLTQLPSKVRQKIEIPVNTQNCKEIRKIYSEIRNNQSGVSLSPSEINKFMSQAYMLTAKAKIKGVTDYITYLIENECKFIIFAHHLDMLDAIQDQAVKLKVGYIRIDGSTSIEKRAKAVYEFQNNKECLIGILSILAAGVGITLTAAATVVIAEMAWSPGVMIQAEDRAHRIGQNKSVNIHYLFGPATLDEYIWPKIHSKLTIITGTLDNNINSATESLLNPECKIGFGDFEANELFNDLKKCSGEIDN